MSNESVSRQFQTAIAARKAARGQDTDEPEESSVVIEETDSTEPQGSGEQTEETEETAADGD